jgi:SPP1 family predicted phage head-tail adaptor
MALSAAELARLRDAHTATLTATCSIWRKVKATNDAGGPDDTWAQQIASVACRVMPSQLQRVLETDAGRETMSAYFRLTVPFDTDIQAEDRIVYDGDSYQVVALWDDHDLRTARRAVIAKVM